MRANSSFSKPRTQSCLTKPFTYLFCFKGVSAELAEEWEKWLAQMAVEK
jgi:hypothetical protein